MQKPEVTNSNMCPIAYALGIFGDKWSFVILRDIIFKGKKYYGEFLASPEKISTNILASRLLKMESEGLISRTQDKQNLSKYIYQLTRKGKDLLPVMLDMVEWSVKYNPQPGITSDIIKGAPIDLLTRLSQERAVLINDILTNMENNNKEL